jgi:hypothetical protein
MPFVRRTIVWILALLGGAGVFAGWYALRVWNQSDLLLRQTVLDWMREIAPEWDVGIARARLDGLGRVHLHDVTLKLKGSAASLAEAKELVLTSNREELTALDPILHHVHFSGLRLHLARRADGRWNWQDVPLPRITRRMFPEWRFENVALLFRLNGDDPSVPDDLAVTRLAVQLVPSARRQYLLKASGRCDRAARISVEGQWNLDEATWNVAGRVEQLRLDDALLQLTSAFSAEFTHALDRLDRLAQRGSSAGRRGAPHDLGLDATSHVTFRVARWNPEAPPEYAATLQFLEGELARPPVPYPLKNLSGLVSFDNDRVEIHELNATTEGTQIAVSQGVIVARDDQRPARFDATLAGLPLDRRLYSLLPASAREVVQKAQPKGQIDASMHVEFDGRDRWEIDWKAVPRQCSMTHVEFPYPVTGLNGLIEQRGDLIDFALEGVAGQRPVKIRGRVKNPGPLARVALVAQVNGLPIDERLHEALSPKMRQIVDALALKGEVDGQLDLSRDPGPNQPITTFVTGSLRNGSVACVKFPYALTKVSGDFSGDADSWEFRNFHGWHDEAEVTASGAYQLDARGVPVLDLQFGCRAVAFDRALRAVLDEGWRAVWEEFNPEGRFNADGRLLWPLDALHPQLRFDAELVDAGLSLRSFPYALTEVRAKIRHEPGEIRIHSLSGVHEETRLSAQGRASYSDTGEWRLRLEPMHIEDIEAGRTFRKALPEGLRNVAEALDPRGRLSIHGMLEFRGMKGGRYPVTAAWDTATVFTGSTLTAGVDLHEMHGTSKFRGTWDGEEVRGDGWMELNSVKVLGYHLQDLHGPVRIVGSSLIVGSRDVLERKSARDVPQADRLTARFIDGTLALDAEIQLGDPMTYNVLMSFEGGQLKRYAQLYMPGQGKLAGVINGSMELRGEGTDYRRLKGSGQLVVAPAALYELPVIVAIFKVLSFRPPTATAFDQARFAFTIRNGLVFFDRIDLTGNAISLVGRGTVRMEDRRLNLDFLSTLGRNQLPIPVVRELMHEATKGWVGVHVEGTLREPRSEVRPVPRIDEALRRLLGLFDPRGPARR